jgi:hypothetical protein
MYLQAGDRASILECLRAELPDWPTRAALTDCVIQLLDLRDAAGKASSAGVPTGLTIQFQQQADRTLASTWNVASRLAAAAGQIDGQWKQKTFWWSGTPKPLPVPPQHQEHLDREACSLQAVTAATTTARNALFAATLNGEHSSFVTDEGLEEASVLLEKLAVATRELADKNRTAQ